MTASRPWILAFGAITLVHLVLLGADVEPWDSVTKCLLAPVLTGWVLAARGPRLLLLALVFCLGGDALLELDGWFVAGMASFAAAHVCFIVLFVRAGALRTRRPAAALAVAYTAAAIGLIAWAWGGLAPELQPIVPVYAALLVGTALTASTMNRLAGVGGAAFLVSDGLIALGEAGRLDPGSATVSVAIMALYAAAISLLTAGSVRLTLEPVP